MPRIEITRKDLSVLQLRAEAARTVDTKQTRRLLSIAMGLDGHSRRLAAQAGGIDRQTLRDWVHHSLTAGEEPELPSIAGKRSSHMVQ